MTSYGRWVSNNKRLFKNTSKPSYIQQKIFDNIQVEICKKKVTLTLNKPEDIGMCILELKNVLMYEFHYDYIKNKYRKDSRLLFRDTDSLMYEIKTERIQEALRNHKEKFDFSNYSTKPKYYDDSNKLVVVKMKDETSSFVTEEFVGLKQKMFLVGDNNEHKKSKRVNKNVAATISHNKHKDVLLNKKWLRHSMTTIQSKDHKIRTSEIKKI